MSLSLTFEGVLTLPAPRTLSYCVSSEGACEIRACSAEAEAKECDYCGLPANVPATIAQVSDSPVATLNAVILPHAVHREKL